MKKIYVLILLLFTSKLFAQIGCQWAYIPIGTSAYHSIFNSTIDVNGNIVQTGKVLGVADMDPGTGPNDTAFTSSGSYNYYVSKINSNGHLEWIKYFKQTGSFDFMGLQVNSNNEVIVVGNFFGLVDFDLSDAGVDTLRSHFPTYPDYFVAKYDSSGNYQWAFNIGNPTTSNIEVQTVNIQANNDIVIAASPSGGTPVDVDPGVAIHNSIGGNANIICYDSNGNYLWNNNISTQYSYANNYKSLDGDALGNNYLLTVGYYELTVNKFDNNGARLWDKTIGNFSTGSRVDPQSVLVDKVNGDFYVAGTFDGTVDFDPGIPTVNETSNNISYQDGFIARYDSSMNLIWVKHYAGNVVFGNYSLDFSGNDIGMVGNLKGTINFGNGFTFSSPTIASPFYVKVDNMGTAIEGYMLAGSGSYFSLNYTSNQTYVTSGYVSGTVNMSPTGMGPSLSSTFSNWFDAVYGWITPVTNLPDHDNSVSVFPNPTSDLIFISCKKDVVVTLQDLNGRIVLSEKVIGGVQNKMSLCNVSNGIYLLKAGNTMQKLTVLK